MGVYGNFLSAFPELMETVQVWTKQDKSDIRLIRCMFVDDKMRGLARRKYTSGNTAHDIEDDDTMYVSVKYKDKIHVGDYFHRTGSPYTERVMRGEDYIKQAGYKMYMTERVTGATADKDQSLPVKEPYFA